MILLLSAALAAELPPIEARTLAGEPVSLPDSPPAPRTLILMGLGREHQAAFEAWRPLVRELAADPTVDWIELPFVDVGAALRLVIEPALEVELAEPLVQAHFAPVWGPPEPWMKALSITSKEHMQLLLLEDGEGRVLVQGAPDEAKLETVREALGSGE